MRLNAKAEKGSTRQKQLGKLIRRADQVAGPIRIGRTGGLGVITTCGAQTAKPATDSCSFVNATVLIAFHEAKQQGFKIPEKIVKRGDRRHHSAAQEGLLLPFTANT